MASDDSAAIVNKRENVARNFFITAPFSQPELAGRYFNEHFRFGTPKIRGISQQQDPHSCHYANERDIIPHRTRSRLAFTAMGSKKGGFYVDSIEPRVWLGGTPCSIVVGRSTSALREKHFHQDGPADCGNGAD